MTYKYYNIAKKLSIDIKHIKNKYNKNVDIKVEAGCFKITTKYEYDMRD
jgi:hypothetical protein